MRYGKRCLQCYCINRDAPLFGDEQNYQCELERGHSGPHHSTGRDGPIYVHFLWDVRPFVLVSPDLLRMEED